MSQIIPFVGKPKTFQSLILYLHSGQNSCFLQKTPFFHNFIFLHKHIEKNHEFKVCLLDPYKHCLGEIVSIHQKFLFLPSNVCNGSTSSCKVVKTF